MHVKKLAAAAAMVGFMAMPASADTCKTHYSLCVSKYGHPPSVCACARQICVKKVGDKDAGPKWDWIPGIPACFRK